MPPKKPLPLSSPKVTVELLTPKKGGAVDGKLLEFVVRDGHLEVMNSVRRVILSEVVTVAPRYDQYRQDAPEHNDVLITLNTTVLHDQIMGHRISMLPIHMGVDKLAAHQRGDLRFEIDVVNNSSESIDVTTRDVVVYDANDSPLNAEQRDMLLPPDAVTGDHPIILRLKPNKSDAFKATFYGRRGIARDNAQWCAASTCAFMFKVDPELADEALSTKLAVKDCNEKEVREQHETLEKFRHFKTDALGDPSEISMKIESECGLSATEIVVQALDVLLLKCDLFASKMTVVSSHPDDPALFLCKLTDEDHTFGNLYQAQCYRLYPERVEYIGYYVPHPLEREVVFKIKLAAETPDMDAFFKDSIHEIRTHIEDLKTKFERATGIA